MESELLPPQPMAEAKPLTQVNPAYNVNLTDMLAFGDAMSAVRSAGMNALAPAAEAVMATFEQIDVQGQTLAKTASDAAASETEMSPGEMIMLTVRAHEFLFQCQLTSNVANRTSDGLQQLFRQQG